MNNHAGAFRFEIQSGQVRNLSPAAWAALNAPWEILANEQGFLAKDVGLRFSPARRLGNPLPPDPPDDYRLGLMFMAAAPRNMRELDYEREELAIIHAVGHNKIDLVVEESGNPEMLGQRLAHVKALQVLHLSCHGHNAWSDYPASAPMPTLFLEDPYGGELPVRADQLQRCWGDHYSPRLLFLSACLSARGNIPNEENKDCSPVRPSLASLLIQGGISAVLGWDGSVSDLGASFFAARLYDYLAKRDSLEASVALARNDMLNGPEEWQRRDWHLARLWFGAKGGGSIVGGTVPRSLLSARFGEKEFLDKKGRVPVASFDRFVGRRREIQTASRVLTQGDWGALAITGMGRLGKSSIAARLANRLRHDYKLVVVFGDYDSASVLDEIEKAFLGDSDVKMIIERHKPLVVREPGALLAALVELLTSLPPILLVIDDLERILKRESAAKQPVDERHVPMLRAVLQAFTPERTASRVLLTSRFPFELGGLENTVFPLELPSFPEKAQEKLLWRQQEAAETLAIGQEKAFTGDELKKRKPLLERACLLSRQNPGLQDLLGERLALAPGMSVEKVTAAMDAMEAWLEGKKDALPGEPAIQEFLAGLALDALLGQAEDGGKALLASCRVFQLPVPQEIILMFQEEIGGDIGTLRGLHLFDVLPDIVDESVEALLVNPLAAGRLGDFDEDSARPLAQTVLPRLFELWGGNDRSEQPIITDRELTRLALLAGDAEIIDACGARALQGVERADGFQAAALMGRGIMALYDVKQRKLPLSLLSRIAVSIAFSGQGAEADVLFRRALELLETMKSNGQPAPENEEFFLLASYGDRLHQSGNLREAQECYERAARISKDDVRSLAVTQGKVADILVARGELDAALRIRQEEQIPVYTRLGDVRSLALTQGQVADILVDRGELDAALRILREELLPVFQRLRDARSLAVTQGKVADILVARGELDAALRIRQEEEIPVYTRLGDVRELAVAQGKVADILVARGELDAALRILREELLPVFQRLRDARSLAVTQGKVADILEARGELDAALRIRQEEEIPVYTRLGDVRELAVAQGKVADILVARGELDAALRILREELLPVFQRLGDVRSLAVTQGRVADILVARGELDAALRIRQEEEIPVYTRLGDVRSLAVAQGKVADILVARGELDAALRIRQEEEIPVYTRLGDARSLAVTQGKVADILVARGELDAALELYTNHALPALEKMRDAHATASVLWRISKIFLMNEEYDIVAEYLPEAYALFEKIGDPYGIIATGRTHGLLLAAYGQEEEGLAVLRRCQQLLLSLGDEEEAREMESLIQHVEGAVAAKAERLAAGLKSSVQGADAAEVAQSLYSYLVDSGMEPMVAFLDGGQAGDSKDAATIMAAAALIIAIPPSVLAVWDLKERVEKRKRAKALIQKAQEILKGKDAEIIIHGLKEDKPLRHMDADELLAWAKAILEKNGP